MKKIIRFLPALIIAGAAALSLSFDNNSRLFSSERENRTVLYETTMEGKHKAVVELCPDGVNYYTTCQAGSAACIAITCPPTETSAEIQ